MYNRAIKNEELTMSEEINSSAVQTDATGDATDAISAVAIVVIPVVGIVYWLSGLPVS